MRSLSNGSKQVLSRVVPHDSIGIHHVGKGLGPQLQVGLVLGDPVGQAVYSLLCKGLQQETDPNRVVADLGQCPDYDSKALSLYLCTMPCFVLPTTVIGDCLKLITTVDCAVV